MHREENTPLYRVKGPKKANNQMTGQKTRNGSGCKTYLCKSSSRSSGADDSQDPFPRGDLYRLVARSSGRYYCVQDAFFNALVAAGSKYSDIAEYCDMAQKDLAFLETDPCTQDPDRPGQWQRTCSATKLGPQRDHEAVASARLLQSLLPYACRAYIKYLT
eukprot:g12017.t1